MNDPGAERDPIERLAESFVARFRAGERPSIEEYVAAQPDLADEIRALLAALVALELNLAPEGPDHVPGGHNDSTSIDQPRHPGRSATS